RKGVVEMKEVNGRIQVTSHPRGKGPVVFKEFDTLNDAYRNKPPSSRVMQAHHGCQNELMARLFGKRGYDGEEVPTIWLRDSTGASPHGIITHAMQNANKQARLEAPDLTYGKIRDIAASDLKAAGAPDAAIHDYMKAIDAYFDANIRPKLKARGELDLVGDLK